MIIKVLPLLILSCHNAMGLKLKGNEPGSSPSSVESTLATTQTMITPNHSQINEPGSSSSSVESTLEPTKTITTPNPTQINQAVGTASPTMMATSEEK